MNSHYKGPVTWSFDVFFDLHLNRRLSKQSWGWWFETTSLSLWHYCNDDSCGFSPTAKTMDHVSVRTPSYQCWKSHCVSETKQTYLPKWAPYLSITLVPSYASNRLPIAIPLWPSSRFNCVDQTAEASLGQTGPSSRGLLPTGHKLGLVQNWAATADRPVKYPWGCVKETRLSRTLLLILEALLLHGLSLPDPLITLHNVKDKFHLYLGMVFIYCGGNMWYEICVVLLIL